MALSLKAQDIIWDIQRRTYQEAARLGLKYDATTPSRTHYDTLYAFVYPIALAEVKATTTKLSYSKGGPEDHANSVAFNAAYKVDSDLEMRAVIEILRNYKPNQGE